VLLRVADTGIIHAGKPTNEDVQPSSRLSSVVDGTRPRLYAFVDGFTLYSPGNSLKLKFGPFPAQLPCVMYARFEGGFSSLQGRAVRVRASSHIHIVANIQGLVTTNFFYFDISYL